jgi:hypothetical protein
MSCDADYTLPCRGSSADCADLPTIFASILDVGVPEGYVCHAFPDAESSRDSFLVGLISFACSLPVTLLITNTFLCANCADYPANWLRWSARRQLVMGRQSWRYSSGASVGFFKMGYATAWGSSWYYHLLQALVVRPQRWMLARDERQRARRGDAPLPAGPARDARAKELQYAFFRGVGIAATYLCWAIFAWVRCVARFLRSPAVAPAVARAALTLRVACAQVIFVYGALLYRLLGAAAQESFTRTWAIGVGISQATQFKARPEICSELPARHHRLLTSAVADAPCATHAGHVPYRRARHRARHGA